MSPQLQTTPQPGTLTTPGGRDRSAAAPRPPLSPDLRAINALHRLSESVIRARSVDEIFAIALDALCGTLDVDRASVLLFDPDGVMRFKAWRGLSDAYRAAVEGHSPWRPDEPNPTPVLIADVSLADAPPGLMETIRAEGIASLAFIPLVYDGRLLGKFMVYRADVHEFSTSEVQLAQTVANHVSFVLGRTRAEARLRESEERFRAMADSAPVLIWVSDAAKAGVYFNSTWLLFTGRTLEQECGDGWLQGVHPDDLPALEVCSRAFAERRPFSTKFRLRRHDGQYRWILDTATPRFDHRAEFQGFIGSCVDVTEIQLAQAMLTAHREHLEALVAERTAQLEQSHQRLRLTERMASIGTLSAGLGHDVANLLLPIRSHVESIDSDPEFPARLRPDLVAVQHCLRYLQRLTNGLRMLALDPAEAPADERTRAAEWWPDVASLFRSVVPRGIKVQSHLPPDLPDLQIAPHRLAQALFNLFSNAADALRTRGSGAVSVRFAPDGDFVRIAVHDDGPGMDEPTRARALEPFFTTKVRTLSTGLGLSLVHGIVRSAGGRVEVNSRPGRGSTITLWVPAARHAPAPRRRAVLHVNDAARRSFVKGLLGEFHFDPAPQDQTDGVHAAILDDSPAALALGERLRAAAPGLPVLIFSSQTQAPIDGSLADAVIPADAPLSAIRDRLRAVICPGVAP